MRRLCCALWLVLLALALPARSEPAQMDALFEALQIDGIVAVMRDEGLVYGAQIADELMPDADRDSWSRAVSRIHAATDMRALVEAEMRRVLGDTDLDPLLAFYASPRGQRITGLELSARRAFMDETIEAEAEAAAKAAETTGAETDLRERVERIIADSDLVELNVAGALNANMMFLRGLVDGGASDLGSEDILRDVWAQEEATRSDTRDWLMAFLMTAYRPLEGGDLDAYSAMWRSPEGRDLNRALFAGFNQMYDQLSYLLARAAAEHMTSAPL